PLPPLTPCLGPCRSCVVVPLWCRISALSLQRAERVCHMLTLKFALLVPGAVCYNAPRSGESPSGLRQRPLEPPYAGSNPASPARYPAGLSLRPVFCCPPPGTIIRRITGPKTL